jgi:hypothetical protein
MVRLKEQSEHKPLLERSNSMSKLSGVGLKRNFRMAQENAIEGYLSPSCMRRRKMC